MTAWVVIAGRPQALQVTPATQGTRVQLRIGADTVEMTGEEARSLADALLTAAVDAADEAERGRLKRRRDVDDTLIGMDQ